MCSKYPDMRLLTHGEARARLFQSRRGRASADRSSGVYLNEGRNGCGYRSLLVDRPRAPVVVFFPQKPSSTKYPRGICAPAVSARANETAIVIVPYPPLIDIHTWSINSNYPRPVIHVHFRHKRRLTPVRLPLITPLAHLTSAKNICLIRYATVSTQTCRYKWCDRKFYRFRHDI